MAAWTVFSFIPWNTNSLEKEYNYREIYLSYFKDSGFQTIEFTERDDTETEIELKFTNSVVFYLPGGDSVFLKREIDKNHYRKGYLIL